jgi:transposase
MYPKLVSVRSGRKKKQTVTYLRLMERVKMDGVWKERVVANLGRQDVQGRQDLGKLLLKLRRFSDEVLVRPEEIESRSALEYGSVLVGQKLWEMIGLDQIVPKVCGERLPVSLGAPGVLAMVLNRLSSARSKLALYDWLPQVYLPVWQSPLFAKLPQDPIDYVDWYYQTMDWLIADKHKEKIEEAIAAWAQTLFPVEVVFYDITNIQFEGWQKLKQARFGHIKLGRRNHKQILLGLVMVERLPVACHLFRGNRAEKTTLLWVHKKLKKQFNVGRIITVADRGQITESTLNQIEIDGDGYIVALKRRRCTEVEPLLEQDASTFIPLIWNRKNILTLAAWEGPIEKTTIPGRPDKRRIVVFNPVKAEEDRAKRVEAIAELGAELQDLQDRVQNKKGPPKSVRAMTIAAEKILSHRNGKRYFQYHVDKDRSFSYEPNEKGRRLEERLDGKWVIRTIEKDLSLKQVVFKYKDLLDVEDGFRHLKDFIKVAPVYHWKYRRVKAHVFLCVLALLLERLLEQKLREANVDLSARKALEKLKQIKVVNNRVGHLDIKYVTPSTEELDKILAACGIYKLPKMLSPLPKYPKNPKKSPR